MKEKDAQTRWNHHLRRHPPEQSESYELKFVNLTNEKSLRFREVADHQINALLASLDGLYYKISDIMPLNSSVGQKPFDCFWLIGVIGYLVIIFWEPRKKMRAYKIPVKDFIHLKNNHPRKSVKEKDLADFPLIEI